MLIECIYLNLFTYKDKQVLNQECTTVQVNPFRRPAEYSYMNCFKIFFERVAASKLVVFATWSIFDNFFFPISQSSSLAVIIEYKLWE